MLRLGLFAAALVSGFALPAVAQDAHDFMNGVYASTEETCEQLKASGLAGMEESAALTAEGLHAYEYACDFVDLKRNAGALGGWVGTAICEEPDLTYPDVVAIIPSEEEGVRVHFLSDRVGSSEETSSDDEEAEADAAADGTEPDAAASEEETSAAVEAEAEPAEAEGESDETEADEESDADVYVFCLGVTKEDLKKGAPN